MKNPNLALREALALRLSTLSLASTAIPIFEEFVEETATKKKAKITIGNMQVEAYCVLLNQTTNNDSAKCARNDLASVQIQCVTVFPANKGGSKTSELISEKVMALLIDESGLFNTLVLEEPFSAWRGELVNIVNIPFNENNSRAWATQLILEYAITQ